LLFHFIGCCNQEKTPVDDTPSHFDSPTRKKNGFVTATKLETNDFFVASTINFAAATKCFVDRTKYFVVVTKYFCYSYFNKLLCWYNKTFFSVYQSWEAKTKKKVFSAPQFPVFSIMTPAFFFFLSEIHFLALVQKARKYSSLEIRYHCYLKYRSKLNIPSRV